MEDEMSQPIAVFDSGLGGLSVVRHLRQHLPAEDIVYFGDTARVPYGTKSRPTVAQFAVELGRFLLAHNPKLMIAACNTASAVALDVIEAEIPVPVIGVVKPGAAEAVQLAGGQPIAVIGTEATISSGAYRSAIRELDPEAVVATRACPLFVPLAEEGRLADDAVLKAVCVDYLAPLHEMGLGALVLGCTHYPLLREAISHAVGEAVTIVDSGEATAHAVVDLLTRRGALSADASPGNLQCFVSDNPERFRTVGSRFLNESIEQVEYVPADQYGAGASAAQLA
jgi:glutamate racemase